MKNIFNVLAIAWLIIAATANAQTTVQINPDYQVNCTLDTITLHVDVTNVTDLYSHSALQLNMIIHY